jgi:predicted nucleic acid-binding protein
MRVFLDTNVFLYAAGRAHPDREGCVHVLRQVAEGALDATVNSEVLQEILYVLARRGRRADGLTLAQHVAALFPDLLPVMRDDLLVACDLLRRYPSLPVRDAVHAATMLRNGLREVISVDQDFDQIEEIRRIAPATV